MEGNDCYKFSTIRNFIRMTGGRQVRVACDVGANVGAISLLMRTYFPQAKIFGYEAVEEYYRMACANTSPDPSIKIRRRAVTSAHLFSDDLGAEPRARPATLQILKAGPEGGPGWMGGSLVTPCVGSPDAQAGATPGYRETQEVVLPITLSEILDEVERETGCSEIDILKLDCEGCEHSTLGCAPVETLRRIRFIVGEYHGIERFYRVMHGKLYLTHKVNLIGDESLGAFFAERLEGEADGILKHNKDGMLVSRPWLSSSPIDWHVFNEVYVLPDERAIHALTLS